LTPFLFLIVVESLARLVRQGVKVELLHDLKIGSHEIEVSVLQFVDNTIFMCESNHQNVLTIKFILRCFELTSGLRVNFHKSKITSIGTEGEVN